METQTEIIGKEVPSTLVIHIVQRQRIACAAAFQSCDTFISWWSTQNENAKIRLTVCLVESVSNLIKFGFFLKTYFVL